MNRLNLERIGGPRDTTVGRLQVFGGHFIEQKSVGEAGVGLVQGNGQVADIYEKSSCQSADLRKDFLAMGTYTKD